MAKRRERGDDRPEWTPADLAALAAEHDLAEIEVERAGTRIRVVRRHPTAMHAGPALAHAAVAEPASAAATAASAEVPANVSIVTAPMVGTFYRSPSPEAAPFVSEGDVVKAGQTLCIIEAMKLMNEIESRSGGRITRILVENGQPVEFGQPLFHLEESR